MIASNVTFIMNGANYLTDAFTTYPFAIFGNGWKKAMDEKFYPQKGNMHIHCLLISSKYKSRLFVALLYDHRSDLKKVSIHSFFFSVDKY
ncbi:MAG: hypothetical protein ABI366_02075, partial [Ginsengibacter sp.]